MGLVQVNQAEGRSGAAGGVLPRRGEALTDGAARPISGGGLQATHVAWLGRLEGQEVTTGTGTRPPGDMV